MRERSFRRRVACLALVLGLGFLWLAYRLFDLQVLRHLELTGKADAYLRVLGVLEPWRGEIRSRDGEAFALDVPVKDIWADPFLCGERAERMAEVLAPVLGVDRAQLTRRLRLQVVGFRDDGEPVYRRAVFLRRGLTPGQWQGVQAVLTNATFGLNPASQDRGERRQLDRLRRKALFARDRHERFYPFGSMLSPVLGFLGRDHDIALPRGRAGLEHSLQWILAGVRGSFRSDKSATGIELPWRRRQVREPEDGHHVVLTIDSSLQQIVEDVLARLMDRHSPSNASILVIRPRTGEILAFGCVPQFDPHRPGASSSDRWRNRAVSDLVEPGSTFKLVTIAAALQEGLVRLEDRIFCEEGAFVYRAPTTGVARPPAITLHDYKAFGWLRVEEVFAKSSNIGMAKLALRLGEDRLYEYIKRFGFGCLSGIALPGETPGRISPPGRWGGGEILYIPMGQGIAVTQLQMTMAYAAIANDGLLMRPMLLKRIESLRGEVLAQWQPQPVHYAVHPQTARWVRQALQTAVSREGTGWAAASERFTLGGKTGTAQKSNSHGYLPGRYYATFIGFLPADRPELCISVAVDEPRNGHQGGLVAAPAFKQVAEAAASLLEIPPDKAPMAGWAESIGSPIGRPVPLTGERRMGLGL